VIELTGVEKHYEGRTILQPTDLTLEAGQTTVLIGPSGCGKSTLLRLMIGLITPDAGKVLFEGEALRPESLGKLRLRMGYVIQDGGLFPHLDARANVSLMARYLGWEETRIDKRLEELVELTHFPRDGLGRFPAQISGGQRQRVSLMRALMLDPDVVLLDEPLGALDPLIRADLQGDLRSIFRSLEKTVVMVTHDLAEAAYFANTIVLMREGRIAQLGSYRDLIERPADEFVSRFVRAQRGLDGEALDGEALDGEALDGEALDGGPS
jgi:osmoprotectant transport system ATP-binding protein